VQGKINTRRGNLVSRLNAFIHAHVPLTVLVITAPVILDVWRLEFGHTRKRRWAVAKNDYSILGVSRTADSAAIHSAFRTLAPSYHPHTGMASSPGKFREAVEAYETPRDPVRRRQHDVDLGFVVTKRQPVPEPRFAPRDRMSAQREHSANSPTTFGALFAEIIRFIGAEFESPLDFY
jgi:DnaJ-class molecular chaperone